MCYFKYENIFIIIFFANKKLNMKIFILNILKNRIDIIILN
jgi:hypothetical protein